MDDTVTGCGRRIYSTTCYGGQREEGKGQENGGLHPSLGLVQMHFLSNTRCNMDMNVSFSLIPRT